MEPAERITQSLKAHYRSRYGGGEQSQSMRFKLLLKNKGQHFVANKEHHRRLAVTHDLFKPCGSTEKGPINRILLEGGAGIGKTSFCEVLVKDWTNGMLFHEEYDVLLYFTLSQQQWWLARSLHELVEMLKLKVNTQDLVDYIQKRNGYGVLVIADGWNDLDRSKCPVQESFFYKLLLGDVLSSASVLVTSRPTASAGLHRDDVIDRYIEICGFDEESMEIFVRSHFSSNHLKADAMIHQMEYNPLLRYMCSFPVTCKYLCRLRHMYDTCSMTELCTKVIMNILCCCCWSMDTPINVSTFPEIDSLPSSLRESWSDICKIAFQSTENEPLDIRSYQDGIMMFGLVEYGASEEDSDKVLVSFPHPTSKEYLAALHVVNQSPGNQLQMLRTIISKRENNPLFWRLYLELSISSDQWSHSVFCQALQMASAFNLRLPKCLLCRCASIARSDTITSEVINCLSTQVETNTIVQLGDAHNSVDCEAMLYVIDNIKDSKCDGLHINFCECGFSSEQIHKLASILASNPAKLQVKELDLSGNNLRDEQVAHLFKTAAASFHSIEKLFVQDNKINKEGIIAIMEALRQSPSPSLKHLDVSLNSLKIRSKTLFESLRNAVKSRRLANLKTLCMQGCLTKNEKNNTKFLKDFTKDIWLYCEALQRIDVRGNDFVTSDVIECIRHLGDNKIHLMLGGKMFIEVMEDSMKKKEMINHTVVHGVFVGPGRSGKNSLMNRLIGEGPSDPNEIIPSTGVLEKVIKVQVKKSCGVATSEKECLHWRRLEYKHEDIELLMATLSSHAARTKEPDASSVDTAAEGVETLHKGSVASATVFSESQTQLGDTNTAESPANHAEEANNESDAVKVAKACVVYRGQASNSHMHSVNPLDRVRHAAELQRMDALREHFESSWMLYLTNTGGQTEFQELLPVLMRGPSVFFVTFPLNQNLNDRYEVRYDGRNKSESYTYQSSVTLMEEILQTVATIDALDRSRTYNNEGALKVLFVGTYKDKLGPKLLKCYSCVDDKTEVIDKRLRDCGIDNQTKSISVDDQNLIETIDEQLREYGVKEINIISVDDQNLKETYAKELRECRDNDQTNIFIVDDQTIIIIVSVSDQIKTIDKQLRDKVKGISLYHPHSTVILHAIDAKQLIFTVNNFDKEYTDFYDIQLRLQKEVECGKFTIECRPSWLILSLVLRHISDSEKWLRYGRYVKLANECSIKSEFDQHEALRFIYDKLGLVYFHNFHMEGLDNLVIIDPLIMFETITQIFNKRIVEVHGDSDEKEDFKRRGVISKMLLDNVYSSDKEKFEKWVIHLLVHLKLVAVFVKEGNEFYFFPSVLCRAQLPVLRRAQLPIQCTNSSTENDPPPLLIGFYSGFCPKGIPGALITYLMSNHEWEFRSKQVYRNQVSFEVRRGVIILKMFCTHIEVRLGVNSEVSDFTEDDKKQTCKEAYSTLNMAMNAVTKKYQCPESENNRFYFFGFYCMYSKCEAHPHFAKLNLQNRKLRCKINDEHTSLPQNYKLWIPQEECHQGILYDYVTVIFQIYIRY